MLELYNTTSDVKRIPKYKYNGKFIIPPHGFVRIEDEQAYFFKPYVRVGIVIRKSVTDTKEKKEEKEIKNTVKEDVKETKEVKVEENPVEEVKEKQEESKEFETKEEKKVEVITDDVNSSPEYSDVAKPVHTYTEEELQEKNLSQLREIASDLGTDASTIRKKDEIRKMILKKQEESVE